MREIKFRAWDKLGKKMANNALEIKNEGSVYFGYGGVELELKNLIWQQYTGLKDKNGVEIYEGDIVHITDEWGGDTKHEIKYMADSDYPAFDLSPWLDVEANGLSYAVAQDGEIEVIGNIYEHPHLLEKGAENA